MATQEIRFDVYDRAGRPLIDPMSVNDLVRHIEGSRRSPWLERLKSWLHRRSQVDFPLAEGVHPADLSQTGWAVVYGADVGRDVKEALAPLVDLRKEQAGEGRFWELACDETTDVSEYLLGLGVGPGTVNPEKFPYYVLLVGSPDSLSFSGQYQLDIQYGVGRLHFDTVDEYAAYAHRVVEAESAGSESPGKREAVFFAPRNPGDPAVGKSHDRLVVPLLGEYGSRDSDTWTARGVLAGEATRHRLLELTSGPEAPDFLFTASHGMGSEPGADDQRQIQGALLCQDWNGPGHLTEGCYLAGDHLPSGTGPAPRIAMLFACFGGGTPAQNDFAFRPDPRSRRRLAPTGFVARLPQRLLGRGTLAVIAHVDVAWSWSFHFGDAGPQLSTLQGTIDRILLGDRIGHATEHLNARYGELLGRLEVWRNRRRGEMPVDDHDIVNRWTAATDARNYVVLGDPAVRLPGVG